MQRLFNWTERDDAQLAELIAAGKSFHAIARIFAIAPQTARKRALRLGLHVAVARPPRPPKPPPPEPGARALAGPDPLPVGHPLALAGWAPMPAAADRHRPADGAP